MQKFFPEIGVLIPEIWLPVPQVDLTRWAVIACDQFTSEPEYWQKVESWVGKAPSTLNLILPEIYLDKPGCREYIEQIHFNMTDFLDRGLLQSHQGMVYIERSISEGVIRRGLMLALDLEQYDYQAGGSGLIRATEGTILERLPPRINVRKGSALELPHIQVLIDDHHGAVHQPAIQSRDHLKLLYDVELPFGSGHLSGWLIDQQDVEQAILRALRNLADPGLFAERYALRKSGEVLLFAVGDGNHSFAAAKAYWEQLKAQPGIGREHPSRFALVEVVNLQDKTLCFEPIHRVLFDVSVDPIEALQTYYHGKVRVRACLGNNPLDEMTAEVNQKPKAHHAFGLITAQGIFVAECDCSDFNLPVGMLQPFLDSILIAEKARRMDYIHGLDVTYRLGIQPQNAGFYLPPMPKEELFRTVMLDGSLPRKTFSMGEARDKRFYMESRKIIV